MEEVEDIVLLNLNIQKLWKNYIEENQSIN